MAQRLLTCDVAEEANTLAAHLGGLTIYLCTRLAYDWVIDTITNTIWILDAGPTTWARDLVAAVNALADHHGVTLQPLGQYLHLVPLPRVGT